MYPDDRVLVGVINRKKDFKIAQDQHWYRIPQAKMPDGIHAEYIAFFLSGSVFKEKSGGIHYLARITGLELARRKDLLPDEAKRPDEIYYKIQLGNLIAKEPPILNSDKRSVSFIHTTWDRFLRAASLADLYSKADYFVDRVYHALREKGIKSIPFRTTDYKISGYVPQVRVLCENGIDVVISSEPDEDELNLLNDEPVDEILAAIFDRIARNGGPVLLDIPLK